MFVSKFIIFLKLTFVRPIVSSNCHYYYCMNFENQARFLPETNSGNFQCLTITFFCRPRIRACKYNKIK